MNPVCCDRVDDSCVLHSCVPPPTPPPLGEPASRDRLWIPCRLFLYYKRCSPSQWNQPMETDINYHLGYHSLLLSTLSFKVEVCPGSLSAYNQKVNYIFYRVEYMLGAMYCSHQANPVTFFIFTFFIPCIMIHLSKCKPTYEHNSVQLQQYFNMSIPTCFWVSVAHHQEGHSCIKQLLNFYHLQYVAELSMNLRQFYYILEMAKRLNDCNENHQLGTLFLYTTE